MKCVCGYDMRTHEPGSICPECGKIPPPECPTITTVALMLLVCIIALFGSFVAMCLIPRGPDASVIDLSSMTDPYGTLIGPYKWKPWALLRDIEATIIGVGIATLVGVWIRPARWSIRKAVLVYALVAAVAPCSFFCATAWMFRFFD